MTTIKKLQNGDSQTQLKAFVVLLVITFIAAAICYYFGINLSGI